MKEITLRVPDELAQLIEEWAEHIPEMEVVKRGHSLYHDDEDIGKKLAAAIDKLKQEGVLLHIYDYTWIMVAIAEGVIEGLGAFRSAQTFKDYLERIGVCPLPSRSTLNTFSNRVDGYYPDWVFSDVDDESECLRRKDVVNRLLEALYDD